MKQQTAINWLVDQIKSDQNQKALSASEWMEVIEQAKQMEKEQIIDAFLEGKVNHSKDWAIEYYNETYGSQGSPDTTTSPNTQNK